MRTVKFTHIPSGKSTAAHLVFFHRRLSPKTLLTASRSQCRGFAVSHQAREICKTEREPDQALNSCKLKNNIFSVITDHGSACEVFTLVRGLYDVRSDAVRSPI